MPLLRVLRQHLFERGKEKLNAELDITRFHEDLLMVRYAARVLLTKS